MAREVLVKLVGYGVKSEQQRSSKCVNGAVMHLAQLDARTGFAMKTMDTEAGLSRPSRRCSQHYLRSTCVVRQRLC